MPYRKVKLYNSSCYHIYNRGLNKSKIFFDQNNYIYFLGKAEKYLTKSADIICYCLMPNHFHFVILVNDQNKITQALTSFFLSYSKAINKSLKRTGPLFEGRFKAKLIPENNYLLHLSRYIHLNPVRAGLVKQTDEWLFSSYKDYVDLNGDSFVKKDIILEQINNYRSFVENYNKDQRELIAELLFG